MTTLPTARECLARLQEELEVQVRRPDGKLLGLPPASEGPGADLQALEELRQELKRKKFLHLSVEAQLSFISGCFQSDLACPEQGQDLEAARREAKDRNQALKREVAREAEEHTRLYQRCAEAYRGSMRQYEECERMLRELQSLVEEEETEEIDLVSEGGSEGLAALNNSLNSSLTGEMEVPRAFLEQANELAKRRRLEYERRCLEKQRRAPEELRAELARLEARERQEVERLERLEQLHCELGLPRIQFDDDKGTIVLGGPPEHGEDIALRTVKVEHDADGHLVRAEPHPSLGLWNEATHCVNDCDLARLLTLVWDRLCEQKGRAYPEPAELGGA